MGIKFAYPLKRYLFSQSKYIFVVLEQVYLSEASTSNTRIEINVKYIRSRGVLLCNPTMYCIIVRNLVYITIIRLDIIYVMSEFVVSPTTH